MCNDVGENGYCNNVSCARREVFLSDLINLVRPADNVSVNSCRHVHRRSDGDHFPLMAAI